jgi:CheY-like chemotaxis protein
LWLGGLKALHETDEGGPKPRILVIDDERAIVAAFVRLFRTQYDVVGLVDAREALQRIADGEHFDAILCDLFMPGMGGVEFYDQLSQVDSSSAGRVIFLSGGAFTQDTQDFLSRVPNPTVSKPFDSEALFGVIRTLTGADRG